MQNCYHCNGECEVELMFDQKVFCCEGCKTVYEILNATDLSAYYVLDKNPGIRANKNVKGKYNFLELDEFRNKLVFFSENGISRIRFLVPQIHCSSCLWLLERLPKLKEGILQSQVNFVKKEVEITFNEQKLALRDLAELLASIGYPPSISMEDYDSKKERFSDRGPIVKIGIAGFCFGNIMLLSFPEYLGIDEHDEKFQTVFNYLNFALSIPVLIYCSSDYFKSALKALRAKFINIDVPITLGIVAFYFQSLFEIFTKTGAGYFDSFAGLIFFLLVGKWFQQTTYGSINFERDYKSYFPVAVTRLTNNQENLIPLKSIRPGDHVLIRNNELIPADGILVRGKGQIDYSFVSGESALISKSPGDRIFAGGRQEGQAIEIEIEKEVANSYLTSLWNNPVFDKEKVNTSFTENITRYFTWIILLLALTGAIFWGFVDSSKSLFVVVSVLIIACPCAIALSVPFTYGNGIRVLGRNSFFLRSAKVIESVSEVTDLVFDKTGTITQNDQSQVHWKGENLDSYELKMVHAVVSQSSHPLSRKIQKHLHEMSGELVMENLVETPGCGISALVDGRQVQVGSAVWLGATDFFEGTRVYVAIDKKLVGFFAFSNVYRLGMERLFLQLHANYRLHVLSGDNAAERSVLESMMPKGTVIHFNQQPEDKLNYIERLQIQGKKVMMLGDGLNDAGALRQSNVGVSVVDDVYAFSPASDIIMDGSQLVKLDDYIRYCKFNKSVVKWSYAFSIFYNVIGLSFALSGSLTPLVAAILMPLSSVSVVVMVTVLTNLRGRRLRA